MHWEDKLAIDLGLKVTGQDFGITNADGKRLGEFLTYFTNNKAIDPWEWEELLDLILESANDAIIDGYISTSQIESIKDIITNSSYKFPEQLEYWSSFDNHEGAYPIVDIIKELKNA